MTDIPTYKIAVSHYQLTQKIPYGSPIWKQFNASFDNCQLSTELVIEAVYKGQSLTTWHKNNWRTSENYICGQHIGLDFDTGDKSSTLPALAADKFISRYGAFIYTTMSHTTEAPRSRVIFTLDAPIMQAQNYTLATAALLWLFGTADRQCKDAVRFFYGSPGCEFEIINNVLPLDVLKRLIQSYRDSGATEKHRAARKDYTAPASQQEVQDALRLINPWGISYDEWVAVLMGIHAQFGNDGLALAEAWGDGKPGEVAQKWRSFDGQGVTVATVFGIAKRFGWKKSEGYHANLSQITH